MARQKIYLLVITVLIGHISYGQIINLDSCGIDANPVLNRYEIAYFDSVLFANYTRKKGFDFKDKKIAFFTCGGDQTHNVFLAKNKYFIMLKPIYKGPRGLFILDEMQKTESGGYDAIIMINCKMYNDKDILTRLKRNSKMK